MSKTHKGQLFYGFEPKAGDDVQYAGCYILKWPHDVLGPPTIAFVEADDKDSVPTQQARIDELEKALRFYADEQFYGELRISTPQHRDIVPIIIDDRGKRARVALAQSLDNKQ